MEESDFLLRFRISYSILPFTYGDIMKHVSIITLVAAVSLFIFRAAHSAPEWKLIGNKDGITYYSSPSPDSPYSRFMGVTVINAPLEVVGEVLRDVSSYPEWMYLCKESRLIRNDGDDRLTIYYVHDSPWPVKDRDTVITTHKTVNDANGSVSISITSLKSDTMSGRGDQIRMNLRVWYTLTYVERNSTKVTFIIKTDPGGGLSSKMVDGATKMHPYHTLNNMRRMVTLNKYIEKGKTSDFRAWADRLKAARGE